MYKTPSSKPGVVGSTPIVSRPLNTKMIKAKEFLVLVEGDT